MLPVFVLLLIFISIQHLCHFTHIIWNGDWHPPNQQGEVLGLFPQSLLQEASHSRQKLELSHFSDHGMCVACTYLCILHDDIDKTRLVIRTTTVLKEHKLNIYGKKGSGLGWGSKVRSTWPKQVTPLLLLHLHYHNFHLTSSRLS